MSWKIPLFKIYNDENDIKAITRVIRSGSNWATGSKVSDFENLLADYNNVKYCLTFNSGTSALHSLLLAYNIKRCDEVIVPSFTFIATANAPLCLKAKPVFAEIENQTFGLDAIDVEKKLMNDFVKFYNELKKQ